MVGESIHVLTDPWLPLYQDPYVCSGSQPLQGQKVSALMNHHLQWDVDFIKDIFDQRDADIIRNIPVHNGVEDSWYWRQDQLGNYTIKSVYHVLQENKHGQNPTPNSRFWRKL